jgi:hypothetical protein
MGAAELFVLAGVVALLFALLTPVRRRLETWLARRLRARSTRPRARVVELGRRRDGSFARRDGNDG